MFPVRDSLRGPLAYKRRARYLDMTCTQAVAATRFPDSPRRSRRRNLFKNSWAVLSYCTCELQPNVCETERSFSKTFLAKATERTSAFYMNRVNICRSLSALKNCRTIYYTWTTGIVQTDRV